MAHLRKDIHSHHSTNNNNLTNIKLVLDDIKTNTNSVNVNTDTLEALQTTANGNLANIQTITDTKLSAIQNFLDKDHAQFHLKHHPDDHHLMIAGNTSADGSGTKNHAHVDGSGVLRVSQVSTQNMAPANTLNSDHASHSQSLAVGIRGRTNITDNTTGKFLLCDSDGHLQCDISNQPNFKLEDLSSSLNAQHASGTTRSVAVGMKAKTNITDPTTSTFLKCSTLGELVNNNSTKNQDITHASVAVTVGAGGVDGEITLNDTDNYARYMVDGGASSFLALYVEGSQDNSNFIVLGQVQPVNVSSTYSGSLLIENPPKYLRLKNHDVSGVAIKIQLIYGRK